MRSIYVSFSLKSFSCADNESFESYYTDFLKPLIKFLNKNPDFHFSFSFSGSEMAFFRKKKEFLKVLSELVKRNQCEVYGGAFYKPVLPLLLPSDRNGQIDLLTTEIREGIGKAPRGLCLFNDVWDSSLLQTLNSCGMDYALFNEELVPESKRFYLPVQMSQLGKSREIYLYNDSIKNDFISEFSEDFLKKLIKKVQKANLDGNDLYSDKKNIVNIAFTKQELKDVLLAFKFSSLLEALKSVDNVILSTISEYSKINTQKIPAFVSSGLCPVLHSISEKSFTVSQTSLSNYYSVYDFMNTYPRSRALYNRMFYVSQLVNQPNKDKAHQKLAKEQLWKGQNGEGIVCPYKNTSQRQYFYKMLMDAENIIRESTGNTESVLSFDYNYDGLPEYICRMKDYFACIALKGGSVTEFQSVKNTGNYTDNYSREADFDGVNDGYERGLFIDHLFTEDQFNAYLNQESAGDGIFSKVVYEEVKFSAKQHELFFKARGNFGSQMVTILKKYIINSSGMNIQYILKNESDSDLNAKFCVESNFAQIDFSEENSGAYKVLLATNTEAFEVATEKTTKDIFARGFVPNINVAQITDEANGISFSFEPNEDCSYCSYPIVFNRPDINTGKTVPLGVTYVSTLFWDLQVPPGKEIEKNFNFTIFSTHKARKKGPKIDISK